MASDHKKVVSIIKELGETDWGKDNDAQGKAVQLMKGLAFSDDPMSNEFMQALSKVSTGIAKRILKADVVEEDVGPFTMVGCPVSMFEEEKKWSIGDGWQQDSDLVQVQGGTTIEILILSLVRYGIEKLSDKNTADETMKKAAPEMELDEYLSLADLKKVAKIPAKFDEPTLMKLLDDLTDINWHKAVRYLRPAIQSIVDGK